MNIETFYTPVVATELTAKSVLVFAPHPDDEVFGCGATLAKLAQDGADINVFVIASRSTGLGAGTSEVRHSESLAAAQLLGYKEPVFFDFNDGELFDNESQISQRVLELLQALNPDLVFAPSIWEMHRDHVCVAQSVLDAISQYDGVADLLMYEVGVALQPNTLIDVTDQYDLKQKAMSVFESQLAAQRYDVHISGLNQFRTYTLSMEVTHAEAFYRLKHADIEQKIVDKEYSRFTAVLQSASTQLTEASNYSEELALLLKAQREESDRLNAETIRLTEERDAASAELLLNKQRLVLLEEQLSEANTLVLSYQNAIFWKVTKPLRRVVEWARGQRSIKRDAIMAIRVLWARIPLPRIAKGYVRAVTTKVGQKLNASYYSGQNSKVARARLVRRLKLLEQSEPLNVSSDFSELPPIDLSIVTYNSAKLLRPFVESLVKQNYPLDLLHLRFTDNSSTDSTVDTLNELREEFGERFAGFDTLERPNQGFGAGHNAAIAPGNNPYILVVNPDIEFDTAMLRSIVADALSSNPEVACWEARQKPFEHPKLYDPVTRETSWCSHACVLLRRDVFEEVGRYDERIFLYGEDVEFSFRLRDAGYQLKYCPKAVVWHYTYEEAGQVKPAQYVGSLIGNLFLRLRFGAFADAIAVIPLAFALMLRSPFPGSRKALFRGMLTRIVPYVPALLIERRSLSQVRHPFRLMDYEQARIGAFCEAQFVKAAVYPLVSIVTRTVAGRDMLLRQCGESVLNQTYPNIEWVVVEDGGDAQRSEVDRFRAAGMNVQYTPLAKVGRSHAGNAGMQNAKGEWLMLLDDDDLLYADHVETLMSEILANPELDAAYSLAWEVESDVKSRGAALAEGEYRQVASLRQPFDSAQLAICNYIPIQAIIFKKTLFDSRGGFDESLDYLEDWHLWRRYAYESNFKFVEKTTSLYRVPMDIGIRAKRQGELDGAYIQVKEMGDQAIERLREELNS